MYDEVMPLRTTNVKIAVLSLDDVHQPCQARRLFRLRTMGERFMLQGYSSECAKLCCSQRQAVRWTGNAYGLPQLASCFAPILECVARSGVVRKEGPHALSDKDILFLLKPAARRRSWSTSTKEKLLTPLKRTAGEESDSAEKMRKAGGCVAVAVAREKESP